MSSHCSEDQRKERQASRLEMNPRKRERERNGEQVSTRLVFINRFYWPDHSATAQILTDLARSLCAPNREIHVITSNLLYDGQEEPMAHNEFVDGVHVHRVWTSRFGRGKLVGRAIDYLSFYVTGFFCLLRVVEAGDTVIAKTDPPLISILAALVCRVKKAFLVNWLQDLFPEVAAALQVRGLSRGPLYSILKSSRNWSLKSARANVVLGKLMASRIESEINGSDRIQIIPNWVIDESIKSIPREENHLVEQWGLSGKFIVGYSGNLGRAHDYQTIFASAELLKEKQDIVFLMIGGGAGYESLKGLVEQAQLENVLFKPYQPATWLSFSLSVPDVHLVSLEPELEGLIFPSKFYGVLAVAKPILFMGDVQGEIASVINSYGIGGALSIGDTEGLTAHIEEMCSNNDLQGQRSERIQALYQQQFLPSHSKRLWSNLLDAD